ncbi:TPA: phage major capsid protein [Streptococcus suis]|uniref:phage major capsid protein n=1 Tax=Streptococcus suis TaxID=1307 RepID=UPI001553846B|nr:phage major capsid protein [Streptococcus suis]HEL1738461.1 phage major capsid protein [Streptococcus suis]HEL1739368.1 phage major capsid protein [Streptococcus suis]HEL2045660.1 phage major capsid protein [Streptococcus suis]HEL2171808.1 phage major capsid protein [Streptococcus suis]
MSTLLELKEKRNTAWEQAKNFLNTVRSEEGLVSEEDAKRYDEMEAKIKLYNKEIARLERQEKLDLELSQPTTQALTSQPTLGVENSKEEKEGIASTIYNETFWTNIRKRNYYDVANVLRVGEDTEGGHLVPDEYEKKLVEGLREENFFRNLATVIKTSSGERKIPVVTGHGTASWMDENGLYPETDETFGQVTLDSYKIGTAIRVSEELINDSVFDLENYMTAEFARRIGTEEEKSFLIGDGSKKPTGIFTQADVTGPTTATKDITFDDMIELYHSLPAPYRKNAVWILHDSTVKAIRKLKDGNGNYIWQPSTQAGQPDLILNRPYYTSTFAPLPEAGNKAIAFGDFSYYWIADRQGRTFKRLNELYAANGQIGFLASQRVDGKLVLPEAVKVLTVKGK